MGEGDLRDDGWCFVCGQENPAGLRLLWEYVRPPGPERDSAGAGEAPSSEGLARARFRPGREHQGWHGVVHGGILAALLDEAMAQRLRFAEIRGVTASLAIRYRRPAPTQGALVIEGTLVSERGRLLQLHSRVIDEAGALLAEAEGTYARLR